MAGTAYATLQPPQTKALHAKIRWFRLSKSVERILRVNHAGEHGAIQIYRAQAMVASYIYKDAVPKLHEMLEHERGHLGLFDGLMNKRAVRPCHALGLWAFGGYLLGMITALLGRNAIWACTEAIETSVLDHLNWQIDYLSRCDREVHAAVLSIIAEEEEHREYGRALSRQGALYWMVSFVAQRSTKAAIWLSERL